ncbi:hypothetical protein [Streptomyces sp. 3213.3]|nr:hypothetical protein [Streptomyces sp. 3213.3]
MSARAAAERLIRWAESGTPAAERLMWLNQAIDPVVTALTGVPART